MAMGRKKQRQQELWIETTQLVQAPGHPFFQKLNALLDAHGFDSMVEEECAQYYHETMGRPSIAPGVYFRMLFIGYFEGLHSERGIAWRVADSIALRAFLGYELTEKTPDHSVVSRTRRLMAYETHNKVFQWVLGVLAKEKLLVGKTLGIDATTLEANAALRSIVRRDTGESYPEFLTQLAQASGIETPTREDLVKLDKKRKGKGSNKDWKHPYDGDARIAKMKDGRTHLAHKAEHAVDLETGAIVGVTLQGADAGDTDTLPNTIDEAQANLDAVAEDDEAAKELKPFKETVVDKGYHSNDTLCDLEELKLRSYASEPDRGQRCWGDKTDERDAVYANRRRIRGKRGKALMRKRCELVERSFAHCYDTGGMRRTHLRHHENILKRLLIHVGAFNLSLIFRQFAGSGTPRGVHALLFDGLREVITRHWRLSELIRAMSIGILHKMRTKMIDSWAALQNLPELARCA